MAATLAPGGGARDSVATAGFGRRLMVIGVPVEANWVLDFILAAMARL